MFCQVVHSVINSCGGQPMRLSSTAVVLLDQVICPVINSCCIDFQVIRPVIGCCIIVRPGDVFSHCLLWYNLSLKVVQLSAGVFGLARVWYGLVRWGVQSSATVILLIQMIHSSSMAMVWFGQQVGSLVGWYMVWHGQLVCLKGLSHQFESG